MIARGALRRLALFGVLFGAGMGAVLWQAGRVPVPESPRLSGNREGAARPLDEAVVPIDAGAAMGSGRGVRVLRDALEVVDGQTLPYRAFEATWERQTPVPGSSAEERRLRTEEFAALVFHRRPTAAEPRPPAIEGPDTTRLRAAEAEMVMRDGAGFRGRLTGDVEIVRHAIDEDLTLRTEALDVQRVDGARGAEDLHATSDERVRIEGTGTFVEGIGLEADLGKGGRGEGAPPPRVLLRRDVSGSLVTRRGALTPLGGDETRDAVPATFACSGAAELVEIAPATRRRSATWRLTLEDDVVVSQAPVEMRCARLEIEFRRSDSDGSAIEILSNVADGGVVVTGNDEDTGDGWTLRAPRSVTRRDGRGGYDVDLEGGTVFHFDGTLRGRGDADGQRGRVEIRCAGPATLHTDAQPAQPGTPIRSRLTFRDDVVARQWDAAGELETEIRAPVVTLLGDRVDGSDARIDPETLTAQGTAAERAHVVRQSLDADADAITWRVLREQDAERLLLNGRPSVRLRGGGDLHLTGSADAGADAVLHLDAEDRVEITWRHTPAAELNLPPGEPYVTALARDKVVVRRLVGDHESYRLDAAAVDTVLDKDLQPTQIRAYGRVLVVGRGERAGERLVTLRGDRLSADRAAGGASDWVRTDVYVFGQSGSLATAVIQEPTETPDDVPVEHEIRAEQLRYQEGGTLLVAVRSAEILLDRAAPTPGGERADIHVRGNELRARLRPPGDEAPDGTPEVVRVEGEGGVMLDTAAYSIRGSDMAYDRLTGVAVAHGRPARGILKHEPVAGLAETESFVASENEIRVEFDPTEKTPGRPRRASCQGGTLRYYQTISETEVERLTVRADGLIEVLGETASAEDDVEIVWESRVAGSAMRQDARVLCERAELAFDIEAEGPARDRVRRAVATGSRTRAAQLFSPRIDASSDRIETHGPWIDLLSPWGRKVHVRQRDPEQSFTCDKGRYNYVTQEFEATRARAD